MSYAVTGFGRRQRRGGAGRYSPVEGARPVLSPIHTRSKRKTCARSSATRWRSAICPSKFDAARYSASWGRTGRERALPSSCCWAWSNRPAEPRSCWARPAGDVAMRREIGFLPEDFRFYDWLTASELLHLHGRLCGVPAHDLRKRVPELVDLVGLTPTSRQAPKGFFQGHAPAHRPGPDADSRARPDFPR